MAGETRAEVVERIVRILREQILQVEPDFDAHTDLVGAGLDSLALTQLLLAIEESTGVWVEESLLTPENLASAEALGALVFDQLQGA